MMTDCDVAIIGYGPTGMVLAGLLGQLGHKVTVCERFAGLYNLPRAACFDDETMRTFQKLGLVEELADGVVVQDDYDWVNADGETLVKLTYDALAPGGWAALYMMYQPHIEMVLDRHDKALPNVEVRQGFTVSGLEQDDECVVLTGSDSDGQTASVRARFVVGADGGNGFVRRSFCKKFDDYGFQENWLVCDFEMKRSVENLPMFRQVCNPAQPTSIVRIGPRHHRFSFMLDADESPERATQAERVWSRVAGYVCAEDAELIRAVNYMFRSRIMELWRFGRVFLAGDAAHEMPPFLGQGMCSGVRDAHNLAWKLDLVLRGRADEVLLDTYQAEREPHVRFITEKAIELGRVQTLRDPEQARQRDAMLMARRRNQPLGDKVRLPSLSGGLIAGNGSFFPQGWVGRDGCEGLFDSIVGYGWCVVAVDRDLLDHLTPASLETLHAIGAKTVVIGGDRAEGTVEDVRGVYAAWFRAQACNAAIIRPDWYVYGTAVAVEELQSLLAHLSQSLNPPTQSASRDTRPAAAPTRM